MMKQIVHFIKTSIFGGTIVIVPVAILFAIFGWLFSLVKSIVNPATLFIMNHSDTQEAIAFAVAVLFVFAICFFIGVFVETRIGGFFHNKIEKMLLLKLPFYSTIKEIILQFLDTKKQPFSKVAVVSIFGNETLMTAFVTDETVIESDILYTVFVPTGPNPTSGNIYHLKSSQVNIVDVPIEQAMKSIIACGSGSICILEEATGNEK